MLGYLWSETYCERDEMKIFRSKIDIWLVALFAVETVAVLAIGFAIALSSGGIGGWSAFLIMLAAASLPIWLVFVWPTEYMVDGNELRIRRGRFSRWTVALDSIISIEPSSSLLSGPVLSLDRLEIKYGMGESVQVSPKDKDGFLRAVGYAGGEKV